MSLMDAAAGVPGWTAGAGHYAGDVVQAFAQSPDAFRVLVSILSAHPHGKAPMPGSVALALVLAALIVYAGERLKPRKRDA